jgi:8-oxo-dGTP diphosphatase
VLGFFVGLAMAGRADFYYLWSPARVWPRVRALARPMAHPSMPTYTHRLRVRVGGLCCRGGELLLVRLRGVGDRPYLWLPPGGGVQFGENLATALGREFGEETGLAVNVGPMRFAGEFVAPPLHSVEFFFAAEATGGQLVTGHDPEVAMQQIEEVAFVPFADLKREPAHCLHGLFAHCQSLEELWQMNGFYTFG